MPPLCVKNVEVSIIQPIRIQNQLPAWLRLKNNSFLMELQREKNHHKFLRILDALWHLREHCTLSAGMATLVLFSDER